MTDIVERLKETEVAAKNLSYWTIAANIHEAADTILALRKRVGELEAGHPVREFPKGITGSLGGNIRALVIDAAHDETWPQILLLHAADELDRLYPAEAALSEAIGHADAMAAWDMASTRAETIAYRQWKEKWRSNHDK